MAYEEQCGGLWEWVTLRASISGDVRRPKPITCETSAVMILLYFCEADHFERSKSYAAGSNGLVYLSIAEDMHRHVRRVERVLFFDYCLRAV